MPPAMKHFSKSSTNIEIRLNEEKFYFPKQPIEGVVQVHPKSPTKANHIRLTFTGEIFLAIKEKETINLFTYAENLPMSKSGKTRVLEAKQHEFPFKFIVPDDLPSTFQFRKPRTWIKYTLTAVLYRPMMMEALSAKATYPVQVLEFIDVESREFAIPRERNVDFSLHDSKFGQQCNVKVTMPKIGYTRGDVVKLGIVLKHYKSIARKNGIKVELVRTMGIQTAKNAHNGEEVLKEQWHDINATGPFNFMQAFDTQIIIPTSTPPSIMYKGLAVQFYYRVRIGMYLNNGTRARDESYRIDMPIIVGTWPKADLPIDDEDEDDEPTPWETTDDEDNMSDSHFSFPQPTPSRSTSVQPASQPRRNTASSTFLPGAVPSVSTITLGVRNITASSIPGNAAIVNNTTTVARSDSNVSHSSNKSRDSIGSHRSSQSYYNNTRSPTLSFSTHGSANPTSPESLHHPSTGLYSPSASNCTLNQSNLQPNHHLNRSISNPDLVNIIPLPVSNTTYGNVNSTVNGHRSSFCDPNPTTIPMSNYSNSNNVVSLQPIFAQSHNQNRAATPSIESATVFMTAVPATTATTATTIGRAAGAINVQPRVLQPISSPTGTPLYYTTQVPPIVTAVPLTSASSASSATVTNLVPRIHRPQNYGVGHFNAPDIDPKRFAARNGDGGGISSSEESDDEDLLRIIERKKKLEEQTKRSSYHRRMH